MELMRAAREHGPSVIRAYLYLRAADSVGRRVRLQGRPMIVNRGRMVIGNRVQLRSVVAMLEMTTEPGGLLEIGDRVFINAGCSIAATKLVRIGDECAIGPHCMLLDNAYHHVEPERRLERPESSPIILERNVWLGPRVIVLPGVTIGADSCVAAASVVTQDVPPRTLVGGVPARVLRSL